MKQGEWIVLTQYSCGCQVRRIRDKITRTFIVITYCPKHKAAPLLHGQLETSIKALSKALAHLSIGEIHEARDYIKGVIAGSEIALAKAEGKEER